MVKKKKVLYIGGFFMPDGNAAAQRVLGIGKLLSCIDYEVKFCGLTRLSPTKETGFIDGFEYVNYPYPKSLIEWIMYLSGRDKSIEEIQNYKPNIVILYNHPALAIEHILKYCKNHNIKVYGDVTEWYEPRGSKIFRLIKGWDVKRRMYVSHTKLDGLICISSFLTNFYRDRQIPTIEIPPLVDIAQAKWNQKKKPESEMVNILYAGTPGDNKDRLDLILQAFDGLDSALKGKINFKIIGINQEDYEAKWKDTKKRSFVSFYGRIPHIEVINKLLSSDYQIFVRPDTITNRAGFPTKLTETISSNTIPITNLNSNLEDFLIEDYNGIIIKNLDRESIMQAIKKAVTLSRNEIDDMKTHINHNMFDYHSFINICKTNVLF